MQERDELLEQEQLPRQEEDIQNFDLDDILKEFGDDTVAQLEKQIAQFAQKYKNEDRKIGPRFSMEKCSFVKSRVLIIM